MDVNYEHLYEQMRSLVVAYQGEIVPIVPALRGLLEESKVMKTIDIKLDPGAFMPTRAHDTDAGLDLYAKTGAWIWPFSRKTIDTGTHAAIREGFVGLLTSKSGLMRKRGLTCRGTIDAGYTGTIQAVMFNHSIIPRRFRAGDKVTQLLILPIETPKPRQVEELEETERGAGGFGSTGR